MLQIEGFGGAGGTPEGGGAGDGGGGGGDSPEWGPTDAPFQDPGTGRGAEVDPRAGEIGVGPRDAQSRGGVTQGPEGGLIDLCWADAHGSGIKPITFVRQVLAACLYPELLHSDRLPVDARQRAQRLLGVCDGGSVGSYSEGWGLAHVQRSVAEFITRRDGGVTSLPENIFITSGSQRALTLILRLVAGAEGAPPTGVLTPAPACHAVAMALAMTPGVVTVPYRLCEERGWALQTDEVRAVLRHARGRCDPTVLYVANPGNPTGHVQSKESIEEVIRLAAEERLVLLVNEVDQDSVHGEGSEFVSYRKVLSEMDPQFSDAVELISLHSISRGFMGEGGLRLGYMELVNVDPAVTSTFRNTLLQVEPATSVPSQIALDLMACPPRPGDPSHATYAEEVRSIRDTLIGNVHRVWEVLASLPGVSCQQGSGGHYVFPRLHLPPAAMERARSVGVEADVLYSRKLLEEERLCVGPGCQFGQREGTHHIRLHVMVRPALLEEALGRLKRFHLRFMRAFTRPAVPVTPPAVCHLV